MKKVMNIIIVISILLVYFMPLNVNAGSKYTVKTIKNDGSIIDISSYDDYSKALEIMNSEDANKDGIACIYDENNKMVNATYAIGDISGHGIIYLYQNATDRELGKTHYTYIEGNWGSEVAVLDYYPGIKPMIKIKISGAVGWTLASNVDVTTINQNRIKITSSINMRVRKEANTESDVLGSVAPNTMHYYYETKYDENDKYTWYKILIDGKYGWVASGIDDEFAKPVKNELRTFYIVENGIIKHKYYSKANGTPKINLGPAPSYLNNDVNYYSFDGNYFYLKIEDMLSDYKLGTYTKAMNYETPYYNYYMYLPLHSKTTYTADDFNLIITGYKLTGRDSSLVYVDNNGNFMPNVNVDNVSALYNQGSSFISFQKNYGVNAFTAFSTALNESGKGTNVYALGKNNVFSIGVCDSCKYANTKTFDSVYDNLIAYGNLINSNYSNPMGNLYYGSHYGNKGSGMGVNYASDPYWGEKQAQYSYLKDKDFGGSDYNMNIIGIKQSYEDVNIYKKPYTASDVIYTLKNNKKNQFVSNIPLTVIGSVVTSSNGIETKWYKVYTDASLDENQNITTSQGYNFNESYGYVKAEYIYISNSDNVIELNDEGYADTDGLFHLENLTFKDDLLNFKGFLIVYGTNNLVSYNPKYIMKFVNQETNEEYKKLLNPSEEPPFEAPSDNGYDYSGSWFNSNLDLSDIPQGDYKIYVTAQLNGYQTTSILTNKLFNRNVTSKYTTKSGRGYQFKSNYYDSSIPLELFIRDNGLISDSITPTTDNMYNQYHSIELKDGFLNLMGTSHNVGGNYSNDSIIERKLIIMNTKTLENNIIVNTDLVLNKPYEVSLRISDGFDKTNAWYQVSTDISALEKGTYVLYINSKVDDINDYGEVSDILYTKINASMEFNDKKYKIIINKNKRYRLELVIE